MGDTASLLTWILSRTLSISHHITEIVIINTGVENVLRASYS